jgi:hypothetical protein
MSTETGLTAIIADAMSKNRTAQASSCLTTTQEDLFEPFTSEDILRARDVIGSDAGALALLDEARSQRRGRPKGALNKDTEDTVAYLSQFGPDPAVAAMKIIATPPEILIERSRREVTRISKSGALVTYIEEMSLAEAMAINMRMITEMLPFWHGKKAIVIDKRVHHDGLLVVAGVTHSVEEVQNIIEAEFAPAELHLPEWEKEHSA